MSDKICSVADCDRKIAARNLCKNHYYRARSHGEFGDIGFCEVEGCTNRRFGKHYCNSHMAAVRTRGVPRLVRPVGLSASKRLKFYGWTERLVVPELGPCWEWNGSKNENGYGSLQIDNQHKVLVHRLAYETWVEPIPEGLLLRHKCDNPPCINSDHLVPGTNADNMRDMRERHRHPGAKGVRNSHAKLTEDEIRDIRAEYAKGVLTQTMIAETYGVSQTQISTVVLQKTWTHLK